MIFMNRLRKNVWCLQGNEVLHRHMDFFAGASIVHEIGRLTGCNFVDNYIFIVKNRIFVSGNCKTFLFSNPLGIFIGISFSLRQVATCTWIRYLDSPASVERPVLRAKKKKRQQLRERVVIGVLPRAACIMTGWWAGWAASSAQEKRNDCGRERRCGPTARTGGWLGYGITIPYPG